MPLRLSPDHKFPKGSPYKLNITAKDDFLNLARRISSPADQQYVIETFKFNFCKASGEQYSRSSSLSWAESDLEWIASSAASNAATFIAAFFDSCEKLKIENYTVPDYELINHVLEKNGINFRIKDNDLITTSDILITVPPAFSPSEIVEKALFDARTLMTASGAASVIDRLHTALHGYLMSLCKDHGIEVSEEHPTAKIFKALRESHPAFSNTGHRAEEVNRMLQGFATSIDAFSTLRNKASLAHANELLDDPEATFVVNAISTIFRYIQDSFKRYTK